VIRVHQEVCAVHAGLYHVQWLWSAPAWLTHRHTYCFWLAILLAQPAELKKIAAMRWPVAEIPRHRRHVQRPAWFNVCGLSSLTRLCLAFRQTTPSRCTICPHVHLLCQLLQSTARLHSVIRHQLDTSYGKDPILDEVCGPRQYLL